MRDKGILKHVSLITGAGDTKEYKELCEIREYLHSVTKCSFADGKVPCKYPSLQCCKSCSSNGAYLSIFPREQEHYLKQFDKAKGFLGNEGCILPVELRSTTCVSYYCPEREKELEHEYGSELESILERVDRQRVRARRLEEKLMKRER